MSPSIRFALTEWHSHLTVAIEHRRRSGELSDLEVLENQLSNCNKALQDLDIAEGRIEALARFKGAFLIQGRRQRSL